MQGVTSYYSACKPPEDEQQYNIRKQDKMFMYHENDYA